jgi:hypothetical protein
MEQEYGLVPRLLRLAHYVRERTFRHHVTAQFQVTCAVVATWLRARVVRHDGT